MEIKTKFNINDLVQYKFHIENNKRSTFFYEIQFIHTETCSAGSQVFYLCRPIAILYSEHYLDNAKVIELSDFDLRKPRDGEYQKFREDEIVPASKNLIEIMNKFNLNQK